MKERHCRRRHWSQALTSGQVRDCRNDARKWRLPLKARSPAVPQDHPMGRHRHKLEHNTRSVMFTICSYCPTVAGDLQCRLPQESTWKRCLLLSFELFVRVAHIRVLWLATIEILLTRQLLDMDDIRSWPTTTAMRRRRWPGVGHRCTPRSRNAAWQTSTTSQSGSPPPHRDGRGELTAVTFSHVRTACAATARVPGRPVRP
jgi:hypothetical protein